VLAQDLTDALAQLLLDEERARPAVAATMAAMIAATTEAVERILVAPTGSIRLANAGLIDIWLAQSERGEDEGQF
jgi:hypothetical protein